MSWWTRKPDATQAGTVLFRGRWTARPEDFASMERQGFRLGAPARREDGGWSVPVEHARWGHGALEALPDPPLPPPLLVDMDPRLDDEEKAAVRSARSAVSLTVEPRSGSVLADRKDLLRFLCAAMGEEGVAAIDHAGQAIWSRAALDVELAHDAELDIDAIYTLHLLVPEGAGPEEDRPVFWLHSHGLQEIGFQDFDVLEPSADLQRHGHELLRALAFATVEERLVPGGAPFDVVKGAPVRAVAAREFLARASASEHREWRRSVDDAHLEGHVVVCDAAPRSVLSRLAGSAPRASRFLRGPFAEDLMIPLSHAATQLMAGRARRMLPVFRELAAVLGELELPALVKLGYRVDGGGPDDREHLWFQVHGFEGDAVDATLLNAPFHVSRLREGERGVHPLDLMSDWMLPTPFGPVNPRQSRTLRFVRANRDRLRELIAAARAGTS